MISIDEAISLVESKYPERGIESITKIDQGYVVEFDAKSSIAGIEVLTYSPCLVREDSGEIVEEYSPLFS